MTAIWKTKALEKTTNIFCLAHAIKRDILHFLNRKRSQDNLQLNKKGRSAAEKQSEIS